MEIDNQNSARMAKLWLVRMPLLVVLVILVLTMMEVIPKATWLIISAGFFFLTLMIVLIGRLHYVKFSIKPDQIKIRHYHLFPLITDYQEFIIQRSDNPEYSLKYSLFNTIPVLHINIQTSQGRAVYPPVPLGLLSKKALNELLKELGL